MPITNTQVERQHDPSESSCDSYAMRSSSRSGSGSPHTHEFVGEPADEPGGERDQRDGRPDREAVDEEPVATERQCAAAA